MDTQATSHMQDGEKPSRNPATKRFSCFACLRTNTGKMKRTQRCPDLVQLICDLCDVVFPKHDPKLRICEACIRLLKMFAQARNNIRHFIKVEKNIPQTFHVKAMIDGKGAKQAWASVEECGLVKTNHSEESLHTLSTNEVLIHPKPYFFNNHWVKNVVPPTGTEWKPTIQSAADYIQPVFVTKGSTKSSQQPLHSASSVPAVSEYDTSRITVIPQIIKPVFVQDEQNVSPTHSQGDYCQQLRPAFATYHSMCDGTDQHTEHAECHVQQENGECVPEADLTAEAGSHNFNDPQILWNPYPTGADCQSMPRAQTATLQENIPSHFPVQNAPKMAVMPCTVAQVVELDDEINTRQQKVASSLSSGQDTMTRTLPPMTNVSQIAKDVDEETQIWFATSLKDTAGNFALRKRVKKSKYVRIAPKLPPSADDNDEESHVQSNSSSDLADGIEMDTVGDHDSSLVGKAATCISQSCKMCRLPPISCVELPTHLQRQLVCAADSGYVRTVLQVVLGSRMLMGLIQHHIIKQISNVCDSLAKAKSKMGPSVLRSGMADEDYEGLDLCAMTVLEMDRCLPFVLQVFTAVVHDTSSRSSLVDLVEPISLMYSIAMHRRSQQLNALQIHLHRMFLTGMKSNNDICGDHGDQNDY